SLIKVLLALKHATLPASIHCEELNPHIELGAVEIVRRTTEWTAPSPRRAGVSSFGFGGVNAHVVVGEAPAADRDEEAVGPFVIPVSARTESALRRSLERLREYLAASPDVSLADVAYTLQ